MIDSRLAYDMIMKLELSDVVVTVKFYSLLLSLIENLIELTISSIPDSDTTDTTNLLIMILIMMLYNVHRNVISC